MKPSTPLLTATGLEFPFPAMSAVAGLSFDIRPGLTLVRGGDGRGKTTVLRTMAGLLPPTVGKIRDDDASLYFETPADAQYDDIAARAWLDARRDRFPSWDVAVEAAWIECFALAEHMPKPMYMLSTGSRRKVGLVGAIASGASVALIDMPYAALDSRSSRMLTRWFVEVAGSSHRACVIADYELPEGLSGAPLGTVIDLGE